MDSDDIGTYSTRASPGDGVTDAALSREPLATEGEATPGPDDENPFDELEDRRARQSPDEGSRGGEPSMPSVTLGHDMDGDDGGGFGLPDFLGF